MERKFNKGDIVQHFKREKMTAEQLKEEPNLYLYEIIGTARHTEEKEELMIYKPLYQRHLYIQFDTKVYKSLILLFLRYVLLYQ